MKPTPFSSSKLGVLAAWRSFTFLGILLLLTAIVFGPALGHHFIAWDDHDEIYLNPAYRHVTWSVLAWNWNHTRMSVWMPLTYYVWGAIAAIAQRPPDAEGIALDPMPFHAACVGFHLVGVALVFLVLRKLVRSDWAALIGAAVFALHPIQVEAVAWASGMYTVLSTVFSLAATHQYLIWVDSPATSLEFDEPSQVEVNRRWVHFAIATLFFCAALLTKPTTIALPATLLAIHLLLIRAHWRKLLLMLATWAPMAVAVFLYARTFHPTPLVTSLSFPQRLYVAADSAGFYLAKIFWPLDEIPDYGRWPEKVIAQGGWFWIAAVVLIVAAASALRFAPRATAAAAVFLIGVGPYLGLVKFDYQFYSTVADRYAYAGMFGIALGIATLLSHSRKRWLDTIAVACAIALAVLSFIQVQRWHDTRSIFNYTLTVRPDSLVANQIMGAEETGHDNDRAEKCFQRAIAERPTSVAHYNYADLLGKYQHDYIRAAQELRAAIAIKPDYYKALSNLAVAEWRMGRYEMAEQDCQQAIDASERAGEPFADPYENLGLLLLARGRYTEAIDRFETALRINPDRPKSKQGLAMARKNSSSVQ